MECTFLLWEWLIEVRNIRSGPAMGVIVDSWECCCQAWTEKTKSNPNPEHDHTFYHHHIVGSDNQLKLTSIRAYRY